MQQPRTGPCCSPAPTAFPGGGFAFPPEGPACGAGPLAGEGLAHAAAGEGAGKPSTGSEATTHSGGSFFPAWSLVVDLFSGAAAL